MTLLQALAQHVTDRLGLVPRPAWDSELREGAESVRQRHGIDLVDLVDRTSGDIDLLLELASHLTVGETHFLRCPVHFRRIAELVGKRLVHEGARSDRIRIWCAGCATGEEVYSVAIAISETGIPAALDRVEILGTDLNARAIASAREGRYRAWSFRGVTPGFLARYTTAEGEHRCVRSALRHGVQFECDSVQRRLLRTPPDSLDAIFFRNVGIYLNALALEEIYRGFRRALRPNGLLLIAPSDPTPDRSLFQRLEASEATGIYRPILPGEAIQQPLATVQRATRSAHERSRPERRAARARFRKRTRAPRPATPQPAPEPAPLPAPSSDRTAIRVLADRGEIEAAIEATDRWLSRTPERDAYLLKGQLLLSLGRAADAVPEMRRASFLDSEDPLTQFWYASALHLSGRADRARKQADLAHRAASALAPETVLSDGESTAAELREAARFLKETLA